MEKTYVEINGRKIQDVNIPKRYFRLFTSLLQANQLSFTETFAAIRVWREVKDNWSSEAMNHCGGFQKAVKAARVYHQRKLKRV